MILDDDILYSKPDPAELVLEHRGPKGWHVDDNGNWIPPVGWVDPEHRSEDFLLNIEEYKKKGLNDTDIAKKFDLTKAEFDSRKSAAINNYKLNEYKTVKNLKEKGYSNREICRKLGWDESKESNVRNYLEPGREAKLEAMKKTSDFIKSKVDEKRYIDISTKTNMSINVSENKFKAAVEDLKMQGYKVYETQITQPTNVNQKTTFRCLCSPDVTAQEFYSMDTKDIGYLNDYVSHDNGETFKKKFVFPRSLDPKRVKIRYRDEAGPDGYTGNDKDGLIEIRRGLDDLSLGKDRYAQVRILVDNDKYLKGMCAYSDDIPDGVDVVFNTNKDSSVPFEKVLKGVKKDADGNIDLTNPFGASIKPMDEGGQYYYKDKDGNEQLGLINKVRGQGEWSEWSKALPSQFLGKQPMKLIEKQLNEKYQNDLEEHQDIMNLTNPTVKKKLLKEFSDNCDTAAVHLKAAALPGQQYHVIIPINSLKDNEVYAPGYKDGTKLALIRYPHAGTFEIPILTVNNKDKLGEKIIGKSSDSMLDAVGINKNVAERLSGADYDGDTVMVIPDADKLGIKSTDRLRGLENFDPSMEYGTTEVTRINKDGEKIKEYITADGRKIKPISEHNKQTQMGVVSNLITDMTLIGASREDLEKAVRHSMVVIDAEKHKYDWKRSEIDNDIARLKRDYQIKVDDEGNYKYGGASTLLSRAKSDVLIPKRQGQGYINSKYINGRLNPRYNPDIPEGEYVYKTSDRAYHPDRPKYDKDSNIRGYYLLDGKKVTYDKTNAKDREYYRPLKDPVIDEKTGEVLYFTNKTGDLKYRPKVLQQKEPAMKLVRDANELVSYKKTPQELAYADYANKMKALANQSRKELMYMVEKPRDPEARIKYMNEVNSLEAKLNEAYKTKPISRAATAIANSEINKVMKNYNLSNKDLKKRKQQETEIAREKVGYKRPTIEITPKEWEAIQANAISKSKLNEILNFCDMDSIREMAMPKERKALTDAQINKAKRLLASGKYTNQEIADAVNASSVSYLLKQIKEK